MERRVREREEAVTATRQQLQEDVRGVEESKREQARKCVEQVARGEYGYGHGGSW